MHPPANESRGGSPSPMHRPSGNSNLPTRCRRCAGRLQFPATTATWQRVATSYVISVPQTHGIVRLASIRRAGIGSVGLVADGGLSDRMNASQQRVGRPESGATEPKDERPDRPYSRLRQNPRRRRDGRARPHERPLPRFLRLVVSATARFVAEGGCLRRNGSCFLSTLSRAHWSNDCTSRSD